jgi:hypothetical protein
MFKGDEKDGRQFLDDKGSFTAGSELGIKPDYNKTLPQIYTELGVKYIEKTQSLRILSSVNHKDSIKDDIPSWIPCWDQGRTFGKALGLIPPSWYTASRGKEAAISIMQDGRALKVHGIILDTIRGTSSPFQGAQFLFRPVSGSGSDINPGNPLEELMEAAGPILSTMPCTYPDIILALALSLTDDMLATSPAESNPSQFVANFAAYRIAKARQLNTVWTGGNEDMLGIWKRARRRGMGIRNGPPRMLMNAVMEESSFSL